MKDTLEHEFDIPFYVKKNDTNYTFYPIGDRRGELFEIEISHPTNERVVVKAYPQLHAANMLRDFANASEEKRKLFRGYLKMFVQKGMKVKVSINGKEVDLNEWPSDWKGLRISLTMLERGDVNKTESTKELAVSTTGMMLSLLNIVPLGYEDGALTRAEVNKYERNKFNRELCLRFHGYNCKICGMSFEKKYGKVGKNYIQVHHIEPVSTMGGAQIINPEKDLIPVCPNCHVMLHTRTPPLSPDELKEMIQEN